MKSLLLVLLALAIVGATMARHHGKRNHHDSDESHHTKEDHHDSDSSSSSSQSDSDSDSHDNSKDHHDSDESHHSKDHHDSDESHHSKDHHDSDESHHSKDHHDSDESHHSKERHHKRRHHDSDESHHKSRHHDSDESHHSRHHDSDESHHSKERHHKRRHHDSDESHHSRHHDSDESHHDSDEDHHDDDDHEYFIHVGDGFGPYEYIDENDGRLKGFDIDLTHAVCNAAHKKCHIVHDTDESCWHTRGAHQLPGPGLLDHWYDGCMGLSPTPERMNSFNFTNSHTPNVKAGLYFRKDEVPAKNDLHGKKIGFVAGWAMSRACLSRQDAFEGNSEPDYTAVLYETHDDLVKALIKKEVDGALSIESVQAEGAKLNLVPAAPWFYCTLSGQSVMARYGSDLIPWWNKALDKLIDSGDYKRLCNKAKDVHASHGQIQCLD